MSWVVNEVAMKWKRSVGIVGLPKARVTLQALRIVEIGNVLAGDERELAAWDHEAGKVAHYWLCLCVKIVARSNPCRFGPHRSVMVPPAWRTLTLLPFGRKPKRGPVGGYGDSES